MGNFPCWDVKLVASWSILELRHRPEHWSNSLQHAIFQLICKSHWTHIDYSEDLPANDYHFFFVFSLECEQLNIPEFHQFWCEKKGWFWSPSSLVLSPYYCFFSPEKNIWRWNIAFFLLSDVNHWDITRSKKIWRWMNYPLLCWGQLNWDRDLPSPDHRLEVFQPCLMSSGMIPQNMASKMVRT